MVKIGWRRPNGEKVDENNYDHSIWLGPEAGKRASGSTAQDALEKLIHGDQESANPVLRKLQTPGSVTERPDSQADVGCVTLSGEFASTDLGSFTFVVNRTSDSFQLCVLNAEDPPAAASYFALTSVPLLTWTRLENRSGRLLPVRLRVTVGGVEVAEGSAGKDGPVLRPFNRLGDERC